MNNFSDAVGFTAHSVYPSFAAPESRLTINGNTLSVSDYAIYKTGYYSINGGAWQNFSLSGNTLSGNWISSTATYTLPTFGTGESYIVIYTCSKTSGTWDCHDGTTGKWQLQIINNTVPSNSLSPIINFITPTPNNAATINTSSAEITANIADDSNTISSWIDFDKSLVGYWSMDYYNSNGIYDNSTYHNFGSFTSGLSMSNIVTGVRGKALSFDGVNDALNLPLSTSVAGRSEITLSMWANFSDTSDARAMYSDYIADGTWKFALNQGFNTPNRLDVEFRNTNTEDTGTRISLVSSVNTPVNQWVHIIVVYSVSNGYVKLYMNGVEVGSTTTNIVPFTSTASAGILIGNDGDPYSPDGFSGSLDEVMLFSRALSASEIKALYDSKTNNFDATLNSLNNGQHTYTIYAIDGLGNIANSGQRTLNVNGAVSCTCPSDGNVCTVDACVNNVCQHTPISGCCTSNSQCSSTQTCTSNACVNNVQSTNDLIINGQSFPSGKDILVSTPTNLKFTNNAITGVESGGHGLVTAPGEATSAQNNYLDAATITGNKMTFGVSQAEQEGFNVGFNVNDVIQYNYFDATQSTGAYGVVFKSGNPNMAYSSGGFAYNIVKNANIGVRIKGMNNVNIYGNTIYDDIHTGNSGLIYISSNSDVANSIASTGTKIKNNIFYSKNSLYMIAVYDIQSASDLQSDYNIFYSESGNPMFIYLGSSKTFAQWQALGYDTHSKVINPNFIDNINFVPSTRLDYGTNLGTAWQAGLSVNAVWSLGSNPTTTNQDSTWQVGARIINSATCSVTNYTPALNTFCDSKSVTDNCHVNSIMTGTLNCISPQTCGGGGTANVCGSSTPPPSGTDSTDLGVCLSAGYNCDTKTISGISRNCGTCSDGLSCTNNLCVNPTSGQTLYVATNGNDNNPGTFSQPYATINKAWSTINAGGIIYVRGGTYTYSMMGQTSLTGRSGQTGKMINIWNYPGEKPIIDFSANTFSTPVRGIALEYSNYIHIKGIRVTSINQPICTSTYCPAQYGLILWNGVNNCIFEQLEFDHIGGWGIVVGDTSSNNLFLNIDSHHNADPNTGSYNGDTYGWSDGFESGSLTSTNNVIDGCRFWSNSDDGLDLRRADGVYTIKNTWSFWNGYIPSTVGTAWTQGGDGTGYKLGGKSAPPTSNILRTITNSLAFGNRGSGFDPQPDDPTLTLGVVMYDCTAYNNARDWGDGFDAGGYNNPTTIKNCLDYNNHVHPPNLNSANVIHDHNSFDLGITVTDADFVSVNSAGIDGPRNADGSLPTLKFLHLASGSKLIDAGTPISGISYSGKAPDLGAYETN